MKTMFEKPYSVDELAGELVAEASLTNAEIAEKIKSMGMYGHCERVPLKEIKKAVARAARKHWDKERKWSGVTDNDKLDQAFEALEKEGILARHNYQCCRSCAYLALSYDVQELSRDRKIDGFVFYHRQDTALVRADRELYLAYDSVTHEQLAKAEVGLRVVSALRKAGFNPEWNCDVDTRIRLFGFFWQRRRKALAA